MRCLIWLVVLIIIAGIVIFGLSVLKNVNEGKGQNNQALSSSNGQNSKNIFDKFKGEKCQSNPNPVFTTNFVDTEKLEYINPIGSVMAGSPGRSYLTVKGARSGDRQTAKLYLPTDATLEGIVFAKRNLNDPQAIGEYRLDFRVSCEVTFHFDHLDSVSEKIKALAPTTPAENTREPARTNLKLPAGEMVGSSDGTQTSGGFDFYLINQAKKVQHINPVRWTWDQTSLADCPYDYFQPQLKEKYYGMLRSQDGTELKKLSCGSPSHDIVGTASGGWYPSQESTSNQGQWLEIADINGRTEILIRENGNHVFAIRDYKTQLLPDKLTIGNQQCYSADGKWMFLKVDSEQKLSLARGEGSCPNSLPISNVEVWER